MKCDRKIGKVCHDKCSVPVSIPPTGATLWKTTAIPKIPIRPSRSIRPRAPFVLFPLYRSIQRHSGNGGKREFSHSPSSRGRTVSHTLIMVFPWYPRNSTTDRTVALRPILDIREGKLTGCGEERTIGGYAPPTRGCRKRQTSPIFNGR